MSHTFTANRALRVYDDKYVRLMLAATGLYCLGLGVVQLYPLLSSFGGQLLALEPAMVTALGLVAAGSILLLRAMRGIMASIVGGFFLEYLSIIPLTHFVFGNSQDARITSIGTPLSFLLLGISIQFLGYRRAFRIRSAFVAMAGSMIMGYGLIGMAKSLADFGSASCLQSLGFTAVGGYLLLAAWYDPIRSVRPLWFNMAVGMGSLTANLVLWHGVVNSSEGSVASPGLGAAVLYSGLLATACLTVVAHFAQTAHAQARNMLLLNEELLESYDATLAGWAHALELRDSETRDHTVRVTDMTVQLAARLDIDQEFIGHIRRGALLHDIGKLGIPDSILLKPGPLNDEEWQIMRQHPVYAYELLKTISYLKPALDIPLHHHEKWDGSGYPAGLAGEAIPFAARMFAIVDVWDALTSDRPYRGAWAPEQVIDYIKTLSGSHFDPQVVEAFVELVEPNSRRMEEHCAASLN